MCENPECPVCPPEQDGIGVAVDPTNATLNFGISQATYEEALREIQRNMRTDRQWNPVTFTTNTAT